MATKVDTSNTARGRTSGLEKKSNEEGLVYSTSEKKFIGIGCGPCGKYQVWGKIFLYRPNGKDILITKKNTMVHSLKFHRENLYHGVGYPYTTIYKTLTKKISKIKLEDLKMVHFNGKDYYRYKNQIIEKKTDNIIAERVINSGDKHYPNSLFLYERTHFTPISEDINSLFVHKNKLYDATESRIFETLTNKKVAEYPRYELSTTHLPPFGRFCSWNNNLYYLGRDGAPNTKKVFNVFTKEILFKRENQIDAVCAVPPKFVDKILELTSLRLMK